MLREACVCKRDAPKCVRIRIWALRRDDSSHALIGAAGMRRSDWCMRNVGALIGQSECRLSASAREDIDSMRAGPTAGGYYISLTLDPKSEEATKEEG